MKSSFSPEELKEIESQLSLPHGKFGLEVGDKMFESNLPMILATFKLSNIQHGQQVLEIGHGNGKHLKQIKENTPDFTYHGLELSSLMFEEAQTANKSFIEKGTAQFSLFDGKTLPYPELTFDQIISVNNLYFWKNAKSYLEQLASRLVVGGYINIGFADESYMKRLDFVQERFTVYNLEKLLKLTENTPLKLVASEIQEDHIESKSGVMVDRSFHVVRLQRTEI